MNKKMRRTGYVFEEKYLWHDPGSLSFDLWVEPSEHWENAATKRRFHSLLATSGLVDKLIPIRARMATREEIVRFHTEEYHDLIVRQSKSGEGGNSRKPGACCRFAMGGYDIAALSAGGVLVALEAIVRGDIDNAYCLVRPPGHHAVKDEGMGFCIFNNVVLAAMHARTLNAGIERVAIVDYDVHHGNGTQEAFYDDPNTLFISLHQDHNYPVDSGGAAEVGGEHAVGANINIPLPPGSGSGAYSYAFDRVVIPALYRFKPDLILVSSGFDANFADPLGSMMLSSESYRQFASSMLRAAEDMCGGRILFAHEGGYSKEYVPFCGLAVVEALCGESSGVADPFLQEVQCLGYQSCQPHQRDAIDSVAAMHGLDDRNDGNGGDVSGLTPREVALLEGLRRLLPERTDSGVRTELVIEKLAKSIKVTQP